MTGELNRFFVPPNIKHNVIIMETTTSLKREYDQKGCVIVRNAIDADLAEETVQHVQ